MTLQRIMMINDYTIQFIDDAVIIKKEGCEVTDEKTRLDVVLAALKLERMRRPEIERCVDGYWRAISENEYAVLKRAYEKGARYLTMDEADDNLNITFHSKMPYTSDGIWYNDKETDFCTPYTVAEELFGRNTDEAGLAFQWLRPGERIELIELL